ncbi:MAG TPA: thiamine pyrophosphate-binding protein [Oligoflexus sp.]|uniref:thiamine pyrophosphate-binding protein n=1 Tax=Oligoflexus sp. TaxID=1971216 RepID=UPI002D7F902B|nr:thiamine pyrophosphate-binding protein [Oligoflexus sp.]HET9240159.1 thiamine pyrophosphate-binding protein [Oligoflexus sp.]
MSLIHDRALAGSGRLHAYSQTETGARILCRALVDSGVHTLFGIPGTHNIEFYDALSEDEDLNPILVTDEQSAGFMADGHYRSSGRMAAVNLVPGAGLTHALSGIAEASLDQIPMLVILCAPRHDLRFAYQLHDIDQKAILKPVAKKVLAIQTHQELYSLTRYAAALAMQAPMGPVGIEVPAELFFKTDRYDASHPWPVLPKNPAGFDELDYQTLLQRVRESKNIGLYLGLGASMPSHWLQKLAEQLDALVFTSISAKGLFPETNPRFVWNGMGRALPPPFQKLEEELDCILAIGCRFSEVATGSYGFDFRVPLLHVDIDPDVLQRNYGAHATLQADAKSFVVRLLLDTEEDQDLSTDLTRLTRVATAHQHSAAELSRDSENSGVNPHRLFQSLQEHFGLDTIFVTDSGNGLFKAMEALRLEEPRSFLAPVDFSCMGYAVPAAIGAKLASPARPVVAAIGDGAVLMTGMEMLTAHNYGLGILFVILNDGKLTQIAQFQKGALGREVLTRIPSLDFAALAKALSLHFLACDDHENLDEVLASAGRLCEQGESVLLSVTTDSSIPSFFTRAVLKTNAARLEWGDRFRMAGRLIKRRVLQ